MGALDTKLLIKSDTTDGSTTFVDSSTYGHGITVSGITHSTTYAKWGASSIYCPGGTSFLEVDTDDLGFGSDNFNIDFWCYQTTYGDTSRNRPIIGQYSTGSTYTFRIYAQAVNSFLSAVFIADDDTMIQLNTFESWVTLLPLNQWNHVRIARYSNSFALVINGTVEATTTSSKTLKTPSRGITTCSFNSGSVDVAFNGYIDELNITIGEDVDYTSAAVPTEAYPIPETSSIFTATAPIPQLSFIESPAHVLASISMIAPSPLLSILGAGVLNHTSPAPSISMSGWSEKVATFRGFIAPVPTLRVAGSIQTTGSLNATSPPPSLSMNSLGHIVGDFSVTSPEPSLTMSGYLGTNVNSFSLVAPAPSMYMIGDYEDLNYEVLRYQRGIV